MLRVGQWARFTSRFYWSFLLLIRAAVVASFDHAQRIVFRWLYRFCEDVDNIWLTKAVVVPTVKQWFWLNYIPWGLFTWRREAWRINAQRKTDKTSLGCSEYRDAKRKAFSEIKTILSTSIHPKLSLVPESMPICLLTHAITRASKTKKLETILNSSNVRGFSLS